MDVSTPETRPGAPGELGKLQEFMNSGHLDGRSVMTPEDFARIQLRAEAGESAASLAREYGVPQGFIAAIRRGAPIFDELDSAEAADEWMRERGFLVGSERLDGAALASLKELREVLREFAAANNGHALSPGAVAAFNALAVGNPLVVATSGEMDARLEPAPGGKSPAVARILATVFEAIRDGSWGRLKRCPGPGCPFTFYDASRNRTGTWCSMSVCGNRTKVRNYQKRRRAASV